MHHSTYKALLGALILAAPVQAQEDLQTRITAALAPTAKSQISCESLTQRRFDGVTLLQAEVKAASETAPDYCRISGVIAPEIQFEVALPSTWNRRLYMFGNGGYAGEDLTEASRQAIRDAHLARGFLTVQQNTGHDARTHPLGSFAEGNLSALVDYSSRAVHETVTLAKDLASAFYTRAPAFSYWDACSTGGRQGLMAAQRHPGDFDGILAGAPVLDFTQTQLWGVWNAQALAKAEALSTAQLATLASAVMAQCDALDGLEDGLITDPRHCTFEPRQHLTLSEAPSDTSFTEGQITALETIAGGVKVRGETVFAGMPWGIEGIDRTGRSGWTPWLVAEGRPSNQLAYGASFLQTMAMLPASGREIDWQSFDFDANYDKIQMIRGILDATNPDMSGFASRGGRILGYFGWADPALNPMMNLAYYDEVQKTMGEAETAEFYRLFMMPGMAHCRGGYGPDTFAKLDYLIDWVENGTAPERILAQDETRSRPLCAHPQIAVYDGQGDPTLAESFNCALP